jgi:hypothetical protein
MSPGCLLRLMGTRPPGGGLAQLGEHDVRNVGVAGSTPVPSTKPSSLVPAAPQAKPLSSLTPPDKPPLIGFFTASGTRGALKGVCPLHGDITRGLTPFAGVGEAETEPSQRQSVIKYHCDRSVIVSKTVHEH